MSNVTTSVFDSFIFERMDRVLTSLLLPSLCATSSWSAASDKLVVSQSPDVSVTEGEMVKISCCWTGNIGRVRVNWLKSQTQNKEDLYMKNQAQVFARKEENNCSTLTFPNISREDAGTYVCKVTIEIPVLSVALGNGTVITVTSNNETSGETSDKTAGDKARDSHQKEEEVLIHVLRCLPILTLIITFFCLYYVGTKAQRKATGHEPAPAQRRKEDQEEEEEREERVV
ncbi:uncharacterized protein LOC125004128 [Mugil cephalus]|uniref:uncharacterized protein LOC125004128 n=1 Tax=Mugil cephalus TaxID=48193 RepID=UPI001FB779FF|nr:uncharacterized protein LOC125004128 [Mugil cephalus]